MKPYWSSAPQWAKWLACDRGGRWNFFEFKPFLISKSYWHENVSTGRCFYGAGFEGSPVSKDFCVNSLEKRK